MSRIAEVLEAAGLGQDVAGLGRARGSAPSSTPPSEGGLVASDACGCF